MTDIATRILEIETELAGLPTGYISRKIISGKERYYLQWMENGKLKSKYIKDAEYEALSAQVEKRKALQEELKHLKETPDGIQNTNLKRKAGRSMHSITGQILSGDTIVATVKDGDMTVTNDKLLPLYLRRANDVEGWLASRAIDAHRTNSRLLKKALRIRTTDDAQTALAVNAATVTDNYWFRPEGSNATFEDVRFKENYFDSLALRGDPDSFGRKPSRTPELTNIGSFEKCWKLIDGAWWMYKSGNDNEYFSELFICKLGEALGLPFAHYEMHDGYIRTRNFTDGTNLNLEPMAALTDDDDYDKCFDIIYDLSPALAEEYLCLIWMDTVCFNMDRHTQNFGFLRDRDSGEILSMAPNYDNNIALVAKGYPNSTVSGMIPFFKEFVAKNETARNMLREMELPNITEEQLYSCIDECPFEVDGERIAAYIMQSQDAVNEIIYSEDLSEGEDAEPKLTL